MCAALFTSESDLLTAALSLIWTAGCRESHERFDDYDGLVRAADWLPRTSCRTFDEIQTFEPILSASCGYKVREMAQFTLPWIRGSRKTSARNASLESSTIDAPADPISGPELYITRKANRSTMIIEIWSDFGIETVYDRCLVAFVYIIYTLKN